MAKDQAARAESCHAAGQRPAPAQPLLAIEFRQRLHGVLLQRSLTTRDRLQQGRGNGIVRGCRGAAPTPASRGRRAVLPVGGRGASLLFSSPSRRDRDRWRRCHPPSNNSGEGLREDRAPGRAAKATLARSHSSSTRCIQKARPDFFLAGSVGMVSVGKGDSSLQGDPGVSGWSGAFSLSGPDRRPMDAITSVMCIFSRFRITLSR